uniref:PPP1R35_C domain-containing protein n=1 Tax=Haemonchus contortus TaxID=6289 RepID=A0A7I4XXV4_HAECO
MCIRRCFRNLNFKKNENKSAEINPVEIIPNGKSKSKEGNPPAACPQKEANKSPAKKVGPKMEAGILKGGSAEKAKPPKLEPLKEAQPKKKEEKDNSARSLYNTFLTEHFENAQITNIVNLKSLNLAAAFTTKQDYTTTQRSTEEARLDTLYKVVDDFPDLIMPRMVDIDKTLPYLRDLAIQTTPCPSSATPDLGGAAGPLKVLLDLCDFKKLRKTQSEEDIVGPPPNVRAEDAEKLESALQEELPHEVSAREPEFIQAAQPQESEVKVTATRAPHPGSRRRTTLRPRNPLKLLRKLLSSSNENVTPEKQEQ